MIGKTPGHCEGIASIGCGDRGEVSQAKDKKLCRDLAIKVVP